MIIAVIYLLVLSNFFVIDSTATGHGESSSHNSNRKDDAAETPSGYRHPIPTIQSHSPLGEDVLFLVGESDEKMQYIPANKHMLSTASEVFKSRFSRWSQEGSMKNPIKLTDISADIFHLILRFIYANDFSGVNHGNILNVYYAENSIFGEIYAITSLMDRCLLWLTDDQNFDVENVFTVLKFAQQIEDKALTDYCWNFVDKNTKEVLKSEEFFTLDQADLCELFGRDTLVLGTLIPGTRIPGTFLKPEENELFLFQSLDRWAKHKCVENELEKTPENKQKVVGDAIYKIRIPLLSHRQFVEQILPSGLLTDEDVKSLHHYYDCRKCEKQKSINPVDHSNCAHCAMSKTKYADRFNGNFRTGPLQTSHCLYGDHDQQNVWFDDLDG